MEESIQYAVPRTQLEDSTQYPVLSTQLEDSSQFPVLSSQLKTSTQYPVLSTQLEDSSQFPVLSSQLEDSTQYPVLSTQLEPTTTVIPWIFAAVDPQAKWWERLRGNPKRSGEVSQAAFLLKAEMMGFHLALPWGDSERWDFAVWSTDERRVVRVQVKGTGRLFRGGYDVQPVHSTRKGGKKRYTKKDIDVIAAHVQPEDVWYLIPIEKVGRAKSLRLDPRRNRARNPSVRRSQRPKHARAKRDWEKWREAWEVLGG